MGLDDGYGGTCKICYTYHLSAQDTICTDCLIDALGQATESRNTKKALSIIKEKLLSGFAAKYMDEITKENWAKLNKFLEDNK